ncbi:hypothetical protein VDBG_03511 [Verticillium alfalfae VaMs.102]|uniref:Uncharacterized protein n=1 Tax=Verticillium alfalfae (strain VaMs.102 / ATCC MYA-4576 / FGSC 10136) TaxID=526221 RepID=C9SFZ8_VERA1|nr:hypothetical protein VDBG_03511 [Verticillium alfalfae VaMs.102]EEY17402.1 hypothetical protein VDBG_03511 [Verticillium alfalfae VaMs.102]
MEESVERRNSSPGSAAWPVRFRLEAAGSSQSQRQLRIEELGWGQMLHEPFNELRDIVLHLGVTP